MKIIFLDVDGVLNSMSYFKKYGYSKNQIDPFALVYLKDLVTVSGAKLVLTSSWRHGWNAKEEKLGEDGRILNRALSQFGLTLFDKTGVAATSMVKSRCEEILIWLRKAPEPVESFVILDDADYAWAEYSLDEFLVQTDFKEGGLMEHHAAKAAEILENPPKPVEQVVHGKQNPVQKLISKISSKRKC